MQSTDDAHVSFVNNRLQEYKKVEIIRRSVRDVLKRGEDMDKHRKMQGKAYEGVKSKVGRNIKVVEKVNKDRILRGEVSPSPTRKRPRTVLDPKKNISRDVSVFGDDISWSRNCTNHRRDLSSNSKACDRNQLTVDRHSCCCHSSRHSSPGDRSMNNSKSISPPRSVSNRSFLTKSQMTTTRRVANSASMMTASKGKKKKTKKGKKVVASGTKTTTKVIKVSMADSPSTPILKPAM